MNHNPITIKLAYLSKFQTINHKNHQKSIIIQQLLSKNWFMNQNPKLAQPINHNFKQLTQNKWNASNIINQILLQSLMNHNLTTTTLAFLNKIQAINHTNHHKPIVIEKLIPDQNPKQTLLLNTSNWINKMQLQSPMNHNLNTAKIAFLS